MSKLVKKALVPIFLCFLLFSLIACDRMGSIYYIIDKEIMKIELIKYTSLEVRNNPLEEYAFDLDKLQILETLDVEKNDEFMQELYRIHSPSVGRYKQVLSSHDGIGVRILYEDNSFQIITLASINDNDYFFIGEYDGIGNRLKSKDEWVLSFANDFNCLLDKYFTTK